MADLERAARLRSLREERGYGQQALADAQGVSLRAYQRQEATGGIKPENAKAIADFYGVELKWLLHGETPDLVGSLNGHQPDELEELREEVRRVRECQGAIVDILSLLAQNAGAREAVARAKAQQALLLAQGIPASRPS
jgi:transcriptional regulator with XRE-family HTH domain